MTSIIDSKSAKDRSVCHISSTSAARKCRLPTDCSCGKYGMLLIFKNPPQNPSRFRFRTTTRFPLLHPLQMLPRVHQPGTTFYHQAAKSTAPTTTTTTNTTMATTCKPARSIEEDCSSKRLIQMWNTIQTNTKTTIIGLTPALIRASLIALHFTIHPPTRTTITQTLFPWWRITSTQTISQQLPHHKRRHQHMHTHPPVLSSFRPHRLLWHQHSCRRHRRHWDFSSLQLWWCDPTTTVTIRTLPIRRPFQIYHDNYPNPKNYVPSCLLLRNNNNNSNSCHVPWIYCIHHPSKQMHPRFHRSVV